MKLICGLGNPGGDYAAHRHNVGFMVLEELARRLGASFDQRKFEGRCAQPTLGSQKLLLLLPATFMNLSGRSVAPAMRFYKVAPEDLLVVHDELDLPFGRLQLKAGGGTGGHNGLASIVDETGEEAFARLRFGVGKPEGPGAKERVVGHVLSGFSPAERQALPELLARAADAAECWASEGLAAAMNRHNRRPSGT